MKYNYAPLLALRLPCVSRVFHRSETAIIKIYLQSEFKDEVAHFRDAVPVAINYHGDGKGQDETFLKPLNFAIIMFYICMVQNVIDLVTTRKTICDMYL